MRAKQIKNKVRQNISKEKLELEISLQNAYIEIDRLKLEIQKLKSLVERYAPSKLKLKSK